MRRIVAKMIASVVLVNAGCTAPPGNLSTQSSESVLGKAHPIAAEKVTSLVLFEGEILPLLNPEDGPPDWHVSSGYKISEHSYSNISPAKCANLVGVEYGYLFKNGWESFFYSVYTGSKKPYSVGQVAAVFPDEEAARNTFSNAIDTIRSCDNLPIEADSQKQREYFHAVVEPDNSKDTLTWREYGHESSPSATRQKECLIRLLENAMFQVCVANFENAGENRAGDEDKQIAKKILDSIIGKL